jgi:hypothetical protein
MTTVPPIPRPDDPPVDPRPDPEPVPPTRPPDPWPEPGPQPRPLPSAWRVDRGPIEAGTGRPARTSTGRGGSSG